jgi:predicted ABC-type ATPase
MTRQHKVRDDASSPVCLVIAGPNGAGKTTFAREYLLRYAGIVHFVNADLIAAGLSPLRPEAAMVAAGRLLLKEIDGLAETGQNFAFESTLSGRTYARRLKTWRTRGYYVEIAYLKVLTPQIALQRIAARVSQGGHDVPKGDVLRRFDRSWENFQQIYKPLADAWFVYDTSRVEPIMVESFP